MNRFLLILFWIPLVSAMELCVGECHTDTVAPKGRLYAIVEQKAYPSLMAACENNIVLHQLFDRFEKEEILAFLTWVLVHEDMLRERLPNSLSYLTGLFIYAIEQQDVSTLASMFALIPQKANVFIDSDDEWIQPALTLATQPHIVRHHERRSPGLRDVFILSLTKPSYHLGTRSDFCNYIADPDSFIVTYGLTVKRTKRCSEGQTPLMWAAMLGDTVRVGIILQLAKEIINYRDTKYAALDYAVKNNHKAVAKMLCEEGATIRSLAMKLAIDKKRYELCYLLISHGAPVTDALLKWALKKGEKRSIGLLFLRWMRAI